MILVISGLLIAGLAVTVILSLNSQFASKSFLKSSVKESDEIANPTESSFGSNEIEENISTGTKNHPKNFTCGKRIAAVGNVWGGVATIVNSWPWVVTLQHLTAQGNKFFCAGSLVSDKHIVSGTYVVQRIYKLDEA